MTEFIEDAEIERQGQEALDEMQRTAAALNTLAQRCIELNRSMRASGKMCHYGDVWHLIERDHKELGLRYDEGRDMFYSVLSKYIDAYTNMDLARRPSLRIEIIAGSRKAA